MTPEIKQEVRDWIVAGCNYESGVELYRKYGRNVMLKRDFPGHQLRYSTKIIYELCKSVGLEYGDLLADKTIVITKAEPVKQSPVKITVCVSQMKIAAVESPVKELPESISNKPVAEYPATVRRVIAEYAEMFQERSKAHHIMTEMPESNSQAVKTKRAELFDLVKSFTVRLEYLFALRTEYERTGYIPEDSEIWPKPKDQVKPELPNDADQLKKMKKNQQSANTKDQNMLDYQSEKRGEVKHPMPTGPKRMKLENRIKARIKMIDEIDYKLLSLTSN